MLVAAEHPYRALSVISDIEADMTPAPGCRASRPRCNPAEEFVGILAPGRPRAREGGVGADQAAALDAEIDECGAPWHRARLRAEAGGSEILRDAGIGRALSELQLAPRDRHPGKPLARRWLLFRRRIAGKFQKRVNCRPLALPG